ncbi:MAG: hypothetical protein HRT88_15875 [Lentisphaeraceae bacterium]|nr:hypothetical protein [Lentisphaeraceae bacterium]
MKKFLIIVGIFLTLYCCQSVSSKACECVGNTADTCQCPAGKCQCGPCQAKNS